MRLVSDIHGAVAALHRAAASDPSDQLLVLGDLVNLIDYRTMDGVIASVLGRDAVAEIARLRLHKEWGEAGRVWMSAFSGTEAELRAAFRRSMEAAYAEICPALAGSGAIVTYGNADSIELLAAALPADCTFVPSSAVFEIEGRRVGVVGGGAQTPLGVPGEVSDEEMTARLGAIGPVDILCTHVAPDVGPLATDVIGGAKGSRPVVDYLMEHRPSHHYFGDIHQPQATSWRVGDTICRNVGYFRSTGRVTRHPGHR